MMVGEATGVVWALSVRSPETFSMATARIGTNARCAGVAGKVLAPCWLAGTLGTSSQCDLKLAL